MPDLGHGDATRTLADRRTGEARACGLDASATLPAGQPEVVVAPGPAFSVDSLDLTRPRSRSAAAPEYAAVDRWTANLANSPSPLADTDQLLVVPESTNIGWIATAPDGTELTTGGRERLAAGLDRARRHRRES